MALVYDVGDGLRIMATFRDTTSTNADPTSVVFKLKDPAGTITMPSVVRDRLGIYFVDVTLNRRGTWNYRWEGTGVVQAAQEGKILVQASSF